MTWGPDPVETRAMPRERWLRLSAGLLTAVIFGTPAAARADGPDVDGDGVPDTIDACPKEPGIKSSDPRTSGCAAKVGGVTVKDEAEITLTGYQPLPGNRGIVFVELTNAVAVEVSRVGQVIEYRLVGASVPFKNNRNPLLLRDFNISALSATLVADPHGKNRRKTKTAAAVRLVISMRGAASPTYRMVQRGTGAVLEVELPPVSAP